MRHGYVTFLCLVTAPANVPSHGYLLANCCRSTGMNSRCRLRFLCRAAGLEPQEPSHVAWRTDCPAVLQLCRLAPRRMLTWAGSSVRLVSGVMEAWSWVNGNAAAGGKPPAMLMTPGTPRKRSISSVDNEGDKERGSGGDDGPKPKALQALGCHELRTPAPGSLRCH